MNTRAGEPKFHFDIVLDISARLEAADKRGSTSSPVSVATATGQPPDTPSSRPAGKAAVVESSDPQENAHVRARNQQAAMTESRGRVAVHGQTPAAAGASFCRISISARTVVFVIDRSASMGQGGLLERAKKELEECLSRLPMSAQFQVIAYNKTAEPLRLASSSGLIPATPDLVRQVIAVLADVYPEGGTDHLRAIERALLLRPEAIFFLSDATDLTERQVRMLTHMNRGRIPIHAIELAGRSTPGGTENLRRMASLTGGQFRQLEP